MLLLGFSLCRLVPLSDSFDVFGDLEKLGVERKYAELVKLLRN